MHDHLCAMKYSLSLILAALAFMAGRATRLQPVTLSVPAPKIYVRLVTPSGNESAYKMINGALVPENRRVIDFTARANDPLGIR